MEGREEWHSSSEMAPAEGNGGGPPQTRGRLRMAVVHRAHRAASPRTVRAVRVADELGQLGWELVFWPKSVAPALADASRNRPVRRTLRRLAESHLLIDRFEPSVALGARRTDSLEVEAGYLLVPGFSPAVHAARALIRKGKPYVVDTGDPWSVTSDSFGRGNIVGRRSRRAERELLSGASGIVVTTDAQATDIRLRFPGTPVLIRPNGYQAVARETVKGRRPREGGLLRLVHFGRFDPTFRVDLMPFLEALAESGIWDRVELTQFGPDLSLLPEPTRPDIQIVPRDLIPWDEAVRISTEFDAALVIGSRRRHWMLLPSKAIEYLGLPIPRIALCEPASKALRDYTTKSPGYLVIDEGDPEAAEKVSKHLERDWTPDLLAAPESESWEFVAPRVAGFVDECIRSALGGSNPARRTVLQP